MHWRAFLSLFVAAVTMNGAVATQVAAQNLRVWYRFGSDESDTTLGQSVGADVWPVYPLWARTGPGKFGGGMVLDGQQGNGLYLPNPASFFGEEACRGTIAMWVKPDFDPAEDKDTRRRVLIDFMVDNLNSDIGGNEIVIFLEAIFSSDGAFVEGPKLKAKVSQYTEMQIDNFSVPLGEWTHLALTWDDQQGAALYVNGALPEDEDGLNKATEGPFQPARLPNDWPGRVGCHTPWGGLPFKGTIDELRLFNYRLSGSEIGEIMSMDPAPPPLSITGDWEDEVSVTNEGAAPITVSLQDWLPAEHLPPPFLGYLPFPFEASSPETLFWVAGTTAADVVSPLPLPAGEMATLPIPQQAGYLGRRRLRVMAGEGLAVIEVAAREWGGLVVEPKVFRPVVLFAERPFSLAVRALNDLGRDFSGTLRAEVATPEGAAPVTASTSPLTLEPGGEQSLTFSSETALPVGAYVVKFVAEEGEGQSVVNQIQVYATKEENARTICDVGAVYVTPLPYAEPYAWLLDMMKDDGVAVLRLGEKDGDYASTEKNLAAVLPYGFKVWRMAPFSYSSVADPASRESHLLTAHHLGRYLRDNPAVLTQVIAGEGLSSPLCYSEQCNQSFQGFLRAKYEEDIDNLNEAWGSAYSDWRDIQQVGGPEYVRPDGTRDPAMCLDFPGPWPADNARAMEWKRWHEQMLVDWYRDFIEAFKETNGGRTPLGEQSTWPNFKTHILFALGDLADIGGMDLWLPAQIRAQIPPTADCAAPHLLNFDLNASIFLSRGKPIMLNELYVQHISPELLPEAQGWWLLGRGYNLLTFFTYDHYPEAPGLIFGMFDKDYITGDNVGVPYDHYYSFVQFSQAIKDFHRRYDYHSLRRERRRVALFLGDDMSLANDLETCLQTETGGASQSQGVRGHIGAYWLTERCGYPVDFINDDGFDRLAGKKVLVVPWSHVIRPRTIERILSFAERGGTVVLDGPVGLHDELYRPYDPPPQGALLNALGVTFTAYDQDADSSVDFNGSTIWTRGVAAGIGAGGGAEVTGADVLYSHEGGKPAVVETRVGRGKVIIFLTNLGWRNRCGVPNALPVWRWALEDRAGLEGRYRLLPEPVATGACDERDCYETGSTANLFDVSAMIKNNNRELFLFLVSFFGPTEGVLELALPPAGYSFSDALTGEAIRPTIQEGKWRIPISMRAYGSRIVRVRSRRGAPFAGW